MLCGRTIPMRCMHQLLAPAGKRLANTGEESGNGPIICKLRTLKFQPSCQGNDAVKLHEFINNDLSKFLMDSRVESEQQKNSSTTRLCLTDLPVGQPICFTSSALHLMCKVFLVVWNPVENTQLSGPKVALSHGSSVAPVLRYFHPSAALLWPQPKGLLAAGWLRTAVYAGATGDDVAETGFVMVRWVRRNFTHRVQKVIKPQQIIDMPMITWIALSLSIRPQISNPTWWQYHPFAP